MNILILTSADHCYANALLGMIIRRGVFTPHKVLVLEQHGLVPGKTMIDGLWRYLRVSGLRYVWWQMAKQFLFQCVRDLSGWLGKRQSLYFPYWRLTGVTLKRRPCPRLSTPEALAIIEAFHPDLILSLYSRDFIPERIFSLPRRGCVNLHPAPLPWYRGVSPTFWMLAQGEERAGVTLYVVDRGYDTGSIIAQRLFPTKGIKSEHALYMKATRYGAALVENFIKSVTRKRAKKITFTPNRKKGSYKSLPTKEAVRAFITRGCRFFSLAEFYHL